MKIVSEKKNTEGTWYHVRVPERIPLYAHVDYIKNIGPPKMAMPKEEAKKSVKPPLLVTKTDERFVALEKEVREQMGDARSTEELERMRLAVADINRKQLSIDNRERRVKLMADILDAEHKRTIADLKAREAEVQGKLDERLKEIYLDLTRAEDFMRTPRVREIVEGHPEERGAVRLCELDGELIAATLEGRLQVGTLVSVAVCELSVDKEYNAASNTVAGQTQCFCRSWSLTAT